jgi:putative ABC transport system permease protein
MSFLAIFVSYMQTAKNASSSNSEISINPRMAEVDFAQISAILAPISIVASIKEEDDKINIFAQSSEQAQDLVLSLRRNLNASEYKINFDGENSVQVLSMLQALSVNLFILVILLGVVSSLIIAGSAELSFLENKQDLQRFRLLGLSNFQIFCSVLIQILTPVFIGVVLGLLLTELFISDLSSLFFNTVSQIPNLNIPLSVSLTYEHYAAASLYGLLVSFLAIVFMLARVLELTPKFIVPAKLLVYLTLSILLVAGLPFILEVTHKFTINLLIINIFLLTLLPTAAFSRFIYLKAASSQIKSVKLAGAYLTENWRWTLIPSLALVSAAVVVIALGILLTSFEYSFKSWLSHSLNKEIFIRRASLSDPSNSNMIDPVDLAILASTQDLIEPAQLSSSIERLENSHILVSGTSDSLADLKKRYAIQEDLSESANQNYFDAGELVLTNEIFCNRFNLKIGDTFKVLGKTRKILAIYRDYGSQLPTVLLPLSILKTEFGVDGVANISFNLKSKTDAAVIINKLTPLLSRDIKLFSKESIQNEALNVFYRTFTVTAVIRLVLLSLIFLTTLMFIVHCNLQERRGLRLLQILGVSPTLFFAYCCLLGLLLLLPAILLGLLGGIYLGYVLVKLLNPAYFGWSLEYKINISDLTTFIVSTAAAVLIAALLSFLLTNKKIKSTELSND